tara:strand:- start:766 stop:921 length:156 start_codon:yes stop_codon:yes gene_type:complete
MARKKKNKTPKARNWVAVHAKGLTGRRGAGYHSKRGYVRQVKHRDRANETQ